MKIGIAGTGGIGSNVAMHLVRSGITNLKFGDFDRIEKSNLNRQFYFEEQISLFSVKEKVAQYLIKMATEQQSRTIRLDVSRQEMADIFGIQKFSLLRCLSEFEEKGAIRIEGKTITILNSDDMK